MGAPPPDLLAFHLGFVVHDLEAVLEAYRRMLGVDLWRVHERLVPKIPWNERSRPARVKIAYGRGVGQTFELIQVLEGWTQHSQFLETHGEGIQHIGFWSPDVRAAVEAAVAEGASIVSAGIESDQAVVQLTPGSSTQEILRAIDRGRISYVDPGLGGVQLEFVGPAAAPDLRAWLAEDFEAIVTPPPWQMS
ncbi:MAG: VOC family protein [Chloroflexota bacterium]|nr:VOC family protein [Chloroflexota bacterium]